MYIGRELTGEAVGIQNCFTRVRGAQKATDLPVLPKGMDVGGTKLLHQITYANPRGQSSEDRDTGARGGVQNDLRLRDVLDVFPGTLKLVVCSNLVVEPIFIPITRPKGHRDESSKFVTPVERGVLILRGQVGSGEGSSNFRWTEKHQQAFRELKQCLVELTTLKPPPPKAPLILYVAAAPKTVSAVQVLCVGDTNGGQVQLYRCGKIALRSTHGPSEAAEIF